MKTTPPAMEWFKVISLEIATFDLLNDAFSDEERKGRTIAALDAFQYLFLRLSASLKLRDDWKTYYDFWVGRTGLIQHSEKMDADFRLGVSDQGWYVDSHIVHPYYIRHMKDDYWEHIVKIASLGKAELDGCNHHLDSSPGGKKLAQHKGSLVFSIARDYVLSTCTPEGCQGLGSIRVTLPLDSDEATVTTLFRESLNSFHRSNYLLHRLYTQDFIRAKKKFLRERSKEPQKQ